MGTTKVKRASGNVLTSKVVEVVDLVVNSFVVSAPFVENVLDFLVAKSVVLVEELAVELYVASVEVVVRLVVTSSVV